MARSGEHTLRRRRSSQALTVRLAALVVIFVCTISPGISSAAVTAPPLEPKGVPGSWHMVLDSEFTDGSLDTDIWQPGWFGTGITGPVNNNEWACYSSDNVTFVPGGSMHLNVTATPSTCQGLAEPYTGAIVSTNPYDGRSSGGFQYQYGVLETKVFIPPYGPYEANWPTIETLGQSWPQDGENDIMEVIYGRVCFNFHSPGYVGGAGLGTCDSSIRPGWHLIAADWEPGVVTYYCDGVKIDQITQGITSAPMYIVLLNTIGTLSSASFRPDILRFAFLRVWQQNPPAPKASTWGCNATSSLLQATDTDRVPCWLTEFGSTALRP